MKTCKTCKNWIDSTADCAIQLKLIYNKMEIPESIELAIDNDSDEKNTCYAWEQMCE